MLAQQSTEAGLLNYLLGRLEKLDADVYCGHNIAAFDMDVLLHRLQHNKVVASCQIRMCANCSSRQAREMVSVLAI